jgi:hypothetical protein
VCAGYVAREFWNLLFTDKDSSVLEYYAVSVEHSTITFTAVREASLFCTYQSTRRKMAKININFVSDHEGPDRE